MKKIILFFTLTTFACLTYGQEITLIDFGLPSQLSTSPWNNVTENRILGSTTILKNDLGESTGEILTLTDAFDDEINGWGTQNPDSGLPFIVTATRDNFFGENVTFTDITENLEPTGGFTLSGLELGKLYSFKIFASRTGVSDNRETLYTITGNAAPQTATLDAANNISNVANIVNVQPNLDGEITIQVTTGPNNDNGFGFYYIGAIEMIKTEDAQPPSIPFLSSTLQTDSTVDLSWTIATDNIAVTGYKVYKDGVLETTLGNVLSYQVISLTANTSYNFTVTALDAAGNESAVSNIVAITTNASSGVGFSYWTINNQNVYYTDGNVGIGTSIPDSKLAVKGSIHSEEVKVDLSVPAPDYVFDTDYKLTPLETIQRYIKQNNHLPNIPSAKELEAHGVELGAMSMKLLEKIEELTLYILEQQERLDLQKSENKTLKSRLTKLETLIKNNKE